MRIPLNFDARDYQAKGLAALDAGVSIAVFCWARRGGKDFTCFAYAVKKMVEKPMNVALVFPTKQQGYEAFWTNIENDGMATLDHIPKELIASQTNSPSNMKIVLKNGSTFTLLGATEPDALRGANAKLYIFSEFVDIPAAALRVVRPIVANNGGQIILQSTPKIDGISGATFKTYFDRALENWTSGKKTQYASRVKATEFMDAELLEDLRQEAIEENGNDFFWRQEYMVNWGQASSTSYYGAVLQYLKKMGRIREAPYNNAHPVYTAWDLGTSDSTAITFFQVINNRVYIIDYYETHDIGYAPMVAFLQTKPYNYGWHFLPWDGTTREQSDARPRIEKLQDCGLVNSSLLQREPVEDGIRRVVERMSQSVFNKATTTNLRRKLQLYKRKFNPLTGDYEGPEHKTESHAADSIRYVYAAIEQEFDTKTGEFLFSPAMAQNGYETDAFTVPTAYRPV